VTYLLAGHIYLKFRQSKCTRLPVDDRHTSGVDFTNVLLAAFTHADPKCAKGHLSHQCLFLLSGSLSIKAARKTLVS
jgi:hypothetical protein